MSVRSEIYAHLLSDSTITALVSTNIFQGLAPLNYDVTNDFIVYQSEVSNVENTIDVKEIFEVNTLTIKAVSRSAVNMEAIKEAITASIQNYTSANIQDILYNRTNYIYDTNDELHISAIDFEVWFCK
jgi:hypothetical protein